MVERDLAKVEVAGSSPVIRSKKQKGDASISFLFFEAEPYGSNPLWFALQTRTVFAVIAWDLD